jgi:hypothetical protein
MKKSRGIRRWIMEMERRRSEEKELERKRNEFEGWNGDD